MERVQSDFQLIFRGFASREALQPQAGLTESQHPALALMAAAPFDEFIGHAGDGEHQADLDGHNEQVAQPRRPDCRKRAAAG